MAVPPPTPPPSPPFMDREYVVKEGKYLHTTPLGEVVTGLMKDKFTDIVDYGLHRRHGGAAWTRWRRAKQNWKEVLGDFYQGFQQGAASRRRRTWTARASRCPTRSPTRSATLCGRQMVVKSGRFGRFLACPGYPGVQVHQAPGDRDAGQAAPSAAAGILKKTSRNGLRLLRLRAQRRQDEAGHATL